MYMDNEDNEGNEGKSEGVKRRQVVMKPLGESLAEGDDVLGPQGELLTSLYRNTKSDEREIKRKGGEMREKNWENFCGLSSD